MDTKIAGEINVLGRFCGKQDIPELSPAAVRDLCGMDRADVMVLFGGSILAGGDLLARAIREGMAKTTVIVGGAGHTTETLRQTVHSRYPGIETAGLPEAEVFQKYLTEVHGCRADYLETESTNCGNNITNLLRLLEEKHIPCRSIILCQDATMQRRMDAGFRKHAPAAIRVINYPAYRATVAWNGERFVYQENIPGMWSVERYVNLLMGEIPRLTDDENGYGPRGRDYIAHVEIPDEVRHAFQFLREKAGFGVREANPLFAG